jgi:hypothetical protein
LLLRGERPRGQITREEFESWERAHVLLAIGDVVERSHGRFSELLPDDVRERYTTARQSAAAVEAGERHAIAHLIAALREIGVPALLLKGAGLAYTVYAAPWLRARSDIDVMVPAGTMPHVADALARLAFEPVREVTHPLITRQRHFVRTGAFRVAVDVHETLVNPPVLRTLPAFDVLYARAQRVTAISPDAHALGTDDALLHALVHRVAHHNSSVDLLWIYDMHLIAERMTPDAWERFVENCVQSRVCCIAADGLDVLVDVLRSPVPVEVIARVSAVPNEPSAALLGGELTELGLEWINFKNLRGVRERLKFVRAHLAPPPGDVSFGAHAGWRLPVRYVARAVLGARKWLRPIARAGEGEEELRKKN